MTGDEVFVLRLALSIANIDLRCLRYRTILYALGEYRARRVLTALCRHGALEHPAYNDYRITEKGRIAIALVNAKGTKP